MIIGVLGAGQLGRMLGLAGIPLGLQFRFLDPEPNSPAAEVGNQIVGSYEDDDSIARFADGLSVATTEFENVPASCLRSLAVHVPVCPSATALEATQDRLIEKRLFSELEIPTPPFLPVGTPGDLLSALNSTGYPAVLKTRRFGYDGKGQWVLYDAGSTKSLIPSLDTSPDALILEGFVKFDRELSLVAARGRGGDIRFYPLVENRHERGILRLSVAPADGTTDVLQRTAEEYVVRIMQALDYVGVLAVELFQCGHRLLANEIAPRVHNSGHWTIEGAETSQFENHLRAILGLPLGSTEPRGFSAMWNVLGAPPVVNEVLAVAGAHLHLYGKEPRSGRKIGHVTLSSPDRGSLDGKLERIRVAAPQS